MIMRDERGQKEGKYSSSLIQELKKIFDAQKILRQKRVERYERGDTLYYEVWGLIPRRRASVLIEVERFVGGGYAGQVYKAKILDLETPQGPIDGLQKGVSYALKIFIPPSGFSRLFRNLIFYLGFQGPFSLQVNPDALRTNALWQKFIRRGASLHFGSEKVIADVHATFIDHNLGSCGELNEWIEGRQWRLEVDDNLDLRLKWKPGKLGKGIGSAEYRAKKTFMMHLVKLMNDMGAYELSRQYEWWTLKSQPNALKCIGENEDEEKGLVAVDFRAGLALLPFLPLCPADFKLILKGIRRGSLVQFDRGDLNKLEKFVHNHKEIFQGMHDSLIELKKVDASYRDSLPDLSHNHLKLLTKKDLRSSILKSSIQSLKIRNIIDEENSKLLNQKKAFALLIYFLGVLPFLGNFLRRLLANKKYRLHYLNLFSSLDYFKRSTRARIAESLIRWHRKGRVNEKLARKILKHPSYFYLLLPFSILPPKLHRFFSDWQFALESLENIFVRPFKLYFNSSLREEWMRDLITKGREEGILTSHDESLIQNQIKEPFIQKYLKSLAVHICTLPVTQIVSLFIAVIYIRLHPELSWQTATLHAGIILGLFQVTPISPGSLTRGLYVTYLVLKEKNFKDYSIAFYLSFFKYIGYLAFPIQMAYRYPDLARFMASHWATQAVHIIPVFGERGALLEHIVFDIFYNYPLTLRRRLRMRKLLRSTLRTRLWHFPFCLILGGALLALIEIGYFKLKSQFPQMSEIWWLILWVPAIVSFLVLKGAKGALLQKRLLLAASGGVFLGFLNGFLSPGLSFFFKIKGNNKLGMDFFMEKALISGIWKAFLFTLISVIVALLLETRPIKETSFSSDD